MVFLVMQESLGDKKYHRVGWSLLPPTTFLGKEIKLRR